MGDISAAKLQAILDSAVNAIITINEEGIVEFFNKAAEEIFGYNKEEIAGKSINALIPGLYFHKLDEYLYKAGDKTIAGLEREVVAKTKDGASFPLDLTVSEAVVDNQRFFTAIIRDASTKRACIALQLENTRIETEIKTKNECIAMISHELKKPLHAIMGYIECLINELDGPLNKMQKEALQKSYNASLHLLQLVNGVLELSKHAYDVSCVEKPAIEDCNIEEILNACIDLIRPLAIKKNIDLEKKLPGKKVTIKGNSTHLQQIVLNLLRNALQFTEKGKIICTLFHSPQGIAISIEDTGIGIEPQYMQRIFTPFVRLFNVEKKIAEIGYQEFDQSFGLGLAITKQLVELYDGRIEVSSIKGSGSVFTVHLPIKDGDDARTAKSK